MSKKIPQLILGAVLLVIVGAAVYMGATGNFSQKQCNLSHDACLIQAADDERKIRDTFIDGKNQELIEFTQKVNAEINEQENKSKVIINGYKDQLSPPTIESEYKANRLQNVPDRLLQFMVPQAQASTNASEEVSLNTEEAKSTYMAIQIDTEPAEGRYRAVLAKYDAPYKNLPIDQYCNEAGMSQRDCDVMVAIAQQESQMGKDFTCTQQTKAHAIELGQTYYFNPMGLMDAKVHWKNGRKSMDFNGCYIRKFDSWEAFWKFMPKSFMDPSMRYYVGNWNTVEELSGIWVTGNKKTPNEPWYKTVNGVLNSGTLNKL